MKTKILAIFIIFLSVSQVMGQNASEARSKYLIAEHSYNSKNYDEALMFLEQSVAAGGGTRDVIEALRLKIYHDQKKWIKAKETLDLLYKLNPDNETLRDLAPFIINVEKEFTQAKKKEEKAAYYLKNSKVFNGVRWMTKRLDVTTFKNGDPIKFAKNEEEWDYYYSNNIPAYCYPLFDNSKYGDIGLLYNYAALTDSRGIAPNGWRIPTIWDYEKLIKSLYYLHPNLKVVKSEDSEGHYIIENLSSFKEYKFDEVFSNAGFNLSRNAPVLDNRIASSRNIDEYYHYGYYWCNTNYKSWREDKTIERRVHTLRVYAFPLGHRSPFGAEMYYIAEREEYYEEGEFPEIWDGFYILCVQ